MDHKNSENLTYDIQEKLKATIDNLIDTEYRSLMACTGEREFGELVVQSDYEALMWGLELYEIAQKVSSIFLRLDQEYAKY